MGLQLELFPEHPARRRAPITWWQRHIARAAIRDCIDILNDATARRKEEEAIRETRRESA